MDEHLTGRPYQLLHEQLAAATRAKNHAYQERNILVSALSKVYPAHLAIHPDSDKTWDDDWRHIVCVHLPTGQATWHVHDSEWHMFIHLTFGDPKCPGYDLHSTEQKYLRVNRLPKTWR